MRAPCRLTQYGPRISAEDQVTRHRFDRQSSHAGYAIQISHVERIVAAQQHAVMPGSADEKIKRRFRVRNRIEVQAAERYGGWIVQAHFRLLPHFPAMFETAGLVWNEAAAVSETDFESGIALQHPAEHETGAGNRGFERQAHHVPQIIRSQ